MAINEGLAAPSSDEQKEFWFIRIAGLFIGLVTLVATIYVAKTMGPDSHPAQNIVSVLLSLTVALWARFIVGTLLWGGFKQGKKASRLWRMVDGYGIYVITLVLMIIAFRLNGQQIVSLFKSWAPLVGG